MSRRLSLALLGALLGGTASAAVLSFQDFGFGPGLGGVGNVVVSPDGRYVYATSGRDSLPNIDGPTLVVLSRDAAGKLKFVQVYSEGPAPGPFCGAGALAVSPDGQNVYVAATCARTVRVFTRDPASGKVSAVGSVSHQDDLPDGLAEVFMLAVSPDGGSLYTVDGEGKTLGVFGRDPGTGMLVYRDGLHLPSPGGAVGTIALSPDSRNLYVPVEAGDRSVVFVFSRDSSTGSVLLQETQHDGLNGFVSIADFRSAVVSADGAYVYTGFTGDAESVMPVFRRDGFSGKLTAIEARPSATMYGARSIAMSPDGGLLYAAGDERLTVVRRDPTTGGVLPIETHDHNGSAFDGPFGIGGLVGTMGIAVSPDGLDVYTASGNDGTVGHFRRLCGNGRRDPGEECDDGNGRDGDGCSALCTIEPCFDCSGDPSTCTPVDGRPCDDGNPRITTERCHGGTCTGGTAANEGRACDDGDACTAGDRCVAGVCRGQEPVVCGLCEACDRRFGWVGTVHDDCHESPTLGRHGTLKFRKHGKGGPLLRWHWVGPQTFLLTDFGVPGLASEPDYQLCLYDHRGLPLAVRHRRAVVAAIHVPAAGRCGKVRCWQAAPNGFRYHDPSAGTDGVTGVSIAAGGQNLASLSLAAHGDRLPFASLPLAPLVTAEFTAPTGVCWRSDYGPFVKKDAADRFIASGGLQVPCRGRCEE